MKQYNLHLDNNLMDAIKMHAIKKGLTIKQIITNAVIAAIGYHNPVDLTCENCEDKTKPKTKFGNI